MRKIAVVTSTRADYGLLSTLLKKMHLDSAIQLQLFVTGMHLLTDYGETYREIEADGLFISRKISLYHEADKNESLTSRKNSALAVAQGIKAFSETFTELQPELVVVLGDRFEMLAVAQSALLLDIPIAHIHGGEVTEGALDDAVRHAITKMASLHFVSTAIYRQRVIQMGERPQSVFNVGAPGLEGLSDISLMSRVELEEDLEFSFKPQTLLVTYHPETLSKLSAEEQVSRLLAALEKIPEANLLFTAPNIDAGGDVIMAQIKDFILNHKDRSTFIHSLGHYRYLSALNFVDSVVGNSSSGIIEVPSFGIATVNIGDRQKGRVRADTVIDVDCTQSNIIEGIRFALGKGKSTVIDNPYQGDNTSEKILLELKRFDYTQGCRKSFYDFSKIPELG